jgi:hypothetical protein
MRLGRCDEQRHDRASGYARCVMRSCDVCTVRYVRRPCAARRRFRRTRRSHQIESRRCARARIDCGTDSARGCRRCRHARRHIVRRADINGSVGTGECVCVERRDAECDSQSERADCRRSAHQCVVCVVRRDVLTCSAGADDDDTAIERKLNAAFRPQKQTLHEVRVCDVT